MVSRVQSTSASALSSLSSLARWNNWTVGIVCALTAAAVYALMKLSQSSATPQKATPPVDPFLTSQHTSGFKIPEGATILNEAPLPFNQFAEGILVLGLQQRGQLKLYIPGESKPFFEQEHQKDSIEEIFLPNLPYSQDVIVTYQVKYDRTEYKHVLKVDQIGAAYILSKNEEKLTLKQEPLQPYKVLPIKEYKEPISIKDSTTTLTFKDDGILVDQTKSKSSPDQLTFDNPGAKRVIQLLTSSDADDSNYLVLSFILGTKEERTIERYGLRDLWENAYEKVTGKSPAHISDLRIHAIGQRIFANIA